MPGSLYEKLWNSHVVADLGRDEVPIDGAVPDPEMRADPQTRSKLSKALAYMDLAPRTPLNRISIDKVFIGSCINRRIEDLRAAAAVVAGRRIAAHVSGIVVPGSAATKAAAEAEGLADIFRAAGFERREAACSMCVAMNDHPLAPGELCASTSNRNFEGRQGAGGRTHLMSPAMAAAAGIAGHLIDVRELVWWSHLHT